jgi:hypothetical protein
MSQREHRAIMRLPSLLIHSPIELPDDAEIRSKKVQSWAVRRLMGPA